MSAVEIFCGVCALVIGALSFALGWRMSKRRRVIVMVPVIVPVGPFGVIPSPEGVN